MQVRTAQTGLSQCLAYSHPEPPIRPLPSGTGRVACDDPPMTKKGSQSRLGIVLRWPIGIALVSWRYMWRTTPLHRSEEQGDRDDVPAGAVADRERKDGRQPLSAGGGQLLHRTYSVRIVRSAMSPADPLALVIGNIK